MAIGDPFPRKSRGRVRRGKLTPPLRPIKLKLKKRPRGKPFPPGNTFGISTRFKEGNRANPGGRPSFKEAHQAARAWLAAKVPGDPHGRTGAEVFVEVLGELGLAGDRAAIAEMIDRAEGRPAVTIVGNDRDDTLTLILEGMNKRSKQIGPPEGFIPRQLVEDTDHEA